MKKTLSLVLTLMLLTSAALAHTHAPADVWNGDPAHHWHDCECGERLDEGAHTLDGFTCTGCGSDVLVYDDGSADLWSYDAYGFLIHSASWDAQGTLTDEYRYEPEYDEDGYLIWQRTYWFDRLVESVSYSVNDLGESIPVRQTGYEEDGSGSVSEYDEWGNVVRIYTYDPMGSIIYEELSDYTYGEDGWILGYRTDGRFDDGTTFQYVYNEYGDRLSSVWYLPDGSIDHAFTHEYGYDEQGNMLWMKLYDQHRLLEESIYAAADDEDFPWYYEKTMIEYHEDGSRTIYEYDQEGELISASEAP